MKCLIVLLLTLFAGCTTTPVVQPPRTMLNISEVAPDKWTAMTRQNVEHLLQVYHLSPLLFTNTIYIQSKVVTHSHPTLTLNTRYAEQPQKLLASFIHEQFHWLAGKKQVEFRKVLAEIRKIVPKKPASETYLHVALCSLEYEALIFYLGKRQADQIVNDFINKENLRPWVYSEVIKNQVQFKKILKRNGVLPPPLM